MTLDLRDSVEPGGTDGPRNRENQGTPPQDSEVLSRLSGAPCGQPELMSLESTDPASKKETILIAESDANLRASMSSSLRDDYHVCAVANGEEAADAARRLHPSLVLADVGTPGLDAFDVLKAMRNDPSLARIPVILLSGPAAEELHDRGVRVSAEDHLLKPFTQHELKARVGAHLRMANMRREASQRESRLRADVELERHQMRDLLAQAPAGIGVMHGAEHRWTYVNDCYVQMTGRSSAADFIGRTIGESLPELRSQRFIPLLDEVYQSGKPYRGREAKVQLQREADGVPYEAYFDFVYQPMRNTNGKVDGIFVHALDVTDKVAARNAAEESAERLTLAQAAAQVGTWEWDPEQNTQRLSPELHRIFGTESTDPEHADVWASRVDKQDLPKVKELMEDGYRTGAMEFDYRYRHPISGLRWFYCRGRRFQGETRMLGIIQDVTDRRSAEEASQRLVAIVESSDDVIISKDLQGIVTSWNPCAERIFGYSAAEMIGKPIMTIIPPELQDDESRILSTITRGDRIEHFETTRVKKNGERIEVSLTVSPVKDDSGRIVGAAKIARDITQRKKAERALRTTEMLASVGRLAATIAHEINNPLEAVINLIYLAKNTEAPEELRKYLTMAEEELDRVSHLTKQTLGFYRETKGATHFRLGALVNSLLPVFSPRARNKGIQLCPEVKEDAELFGVPGEIRQVIANLVSNSIDATDAGGKIHIRVSASRQWKDGMRKGVRLTVADSGSGVTAAARSKLFEPFFTTKRDVGTGLGLWVCKSIVENHRGSILLRSSTTPGRSGTVFSVFFPLEASSLDPGERSANPNQSDAASTLSRGDLDVLQRAS
ncbi:MAG: PAS domain S-box protein [Terracidiphilus sp.]